MHSALDERDACKTNWGRQSRSEMLRVLSPVEVAGMVEVETKPQWKMGCEFNKTMGRPAKPFYSVDEKYVVLCKPGQRDFAVQMMFSAWHRE